MNTLAQASDAREMVQLTRDVDEKLGKSTEGIWNGLPPERDGRDETILNTLGVGRAVPAAGGSLIGLVAEDCVTDACECAEEETGADTGDRAVVDSALSQEGVEAVLKRSLVTEVNVRAGSIGFELRGQNLH